MPSAKKETREVLYDKPSMRLFAGDKALTVTQAKKWLGWSPIRDKEDDYLLKDLNGKSIQCHNNMHNRPFTRSNADFLKQEILRGRWKLNGESRIIGRTGQIISAQHTLIGLILAVQEWEKNPDKYPHWDAEPTMETYVVFGIAEEDEVVNTIDTPKLRTLDEVIFRSGYFDDLEKKDRKKVSRILSYAVKFVWDRTGVKNAFAIRRTHAESLDFIARHPKLVECTRHIYEEDSDDNQIRWYISLGYASGLLYLMGSATTDAAKYHHDENLREDLLDWKLWDKACDFFVLLANKSPEVACVRTSLLKLKNNDESNYASQCATIVKAWNLHVEKEEITDEALKLNYQKNQDGFQELAECPTVGGIDLGNGEDVERATGGDPTPSEIKERAEKERSGKSEPKKTSKSRGKTKPSKLVGKLMWVKDPKEPWRGKVLKVTGKSVELKTLQGFQGAGNIRSTNITNLTKTQPK